MQGCSSTRTGSSPPTRPPAASRGGFTPRCATCRSSPRTGTCRRSGSPRTSRSGISPPLLISPDHYVTRLLHAHGVPLEHLGGGGEPADPRAAWRALCTHWNAFRGTPSRFWMESELAEIFGVTARPSAATADAIYDQVADTLRRPDFRPRALLDRFRIDVLATTDDPCDDLA